jgi:hypothetical protein
MMIREKGKEVLQKVSVYYNMHVEEEVSLSQQLEAIMCNIGGSKEGTKGWFLFI